MQRKDTRIIVNGTSDSACAFCGSQENVLDTSGSTPRQEHLPLCLVCAGSIASGQ